MNFIKKLFSNSAPQQQVDDSPLERPADWNLTLDDLFAEMEAGKRNSIGSPEGDWAKEYELSLLPDGTRFPKKGDLYESNKEQTLSYMTAWSAPFTGEGEGLLFEGERIWIKEDASGESALGAYAIPVEYEKLEIRMVPSEEREKPQFDGFYFYFKTIDLNRNFTLIQTEFNGKECLTTNIAN